MAPNKTVMTRKTLTARIKQAHSEMVGELMNESLQQVQRRRLRRWRRHYSKSVMRVDGVTVNNLKPQATSSTCRLVTLRWLACSHVQLCKLPSWDVRYDTSFPSPAAVDDCSAALDSLLYFASKQARWQYIRATVDVESKPVRWQCCHK